MGLKRGCCKSNIVTQIVKDLVENVETCIDNAEKFRTWIPYVELVNPGRENHVGQFV